jgi:MoaA/NifB/PqqE/SkfB family radical SAM enzyme
MFPTVGEKVDEAMETFIELKREGHRLYQTEREFRDIRHYFHSPDQLRPGQCVSMDMHMMVDLFGDVRLCFNADRLGLDPVGNIHERSLQEIWEDPETEAIREQMRTCRNGCGTMLCHARK